MNGLAGYCCSNPRVAVSKITFTPKTESLLDRAETICARRGIRFTDLRRIVLGLVLESPKPAGAYELLDQLRVHEKGSAPPTVYRALDFLVEQGLIHKVERLSAFVGCVHGIGEEPHQAHDHPHVTPFLVCRTCGRAAELDDEAVGKALIHAARETGFTLFGSTVELEGVCAGCAGGKAG